MARPKRPDSPEAQEEIDGALETIKKVARPPKDKIGDMADQEIERQIEAIEGLRGSMPMDLTGHVYREVQGMGRFREGQIQEVIDDHTCGIMFGPGKWRIVYRYRTPSMADHSEPKTCTVMYNIGPGYAEMYREFCRMNNQPCRLDSQQPAPQAQEKKGLPDLLSKERAESLSIIATTLLGILRPDRIEDKAAQGAIDRQERLLLALIENMGKGSSGGANDKVLEKLLDNALGGEKKDSLREMENMFGLMEKIKALTGDAQSSAEPATPFDGLISKAMDLLPVFLEKFGGSGNEAQAAQALVQENPMAKMLLNSRAAQKAFYRSLSKKYGQLSADSWARGFNIDPAGLRADATSPARRRIQPPQAPAPENAAKPVQESILGKLDRKPGFRTFGRKGAA